MNTNQLNLFGLLDLSNANEIVLVANTPSYLLDRLRKDASVGHIAQTLSTPTILDALRTWSATNPQSVQDVVQRYVYLAALAMKDPSEIWPGLAEINLQRLEWGDQIREIIKAENVATNRIVIGAPSAEINQSVTWVEATNTRTSRLIQKDPQHSRIIT
jgi:hypothetical protein